MPLKYGHGQHSGWPPHSVDPIQDTLLPGNHGNQHPKLSLTVLSTKAVRTSLKPVATRTASVKSGLTNLSNMADGSHIFSTFVTLQCTCGKPGCRTFWEAACEELPPAKGFFSPGKKLKKGGCVSSVFCWVHWLAFSLLNLAYALGSSKFTKRRFKTCYAVGSTSKESPEIIGTNQKKNKCRNLATKTQCTQRLLGQKVRGLTVQSATNQEPSCIQSFLLPNPPSWELRSAIAMLASTPLPLFEATSAHHQPWWKTHGTKLWNQRPLHRQNPRPAPALVHHQVLREQHRGSCYNSGSDTLPNQIESIELNDGGNVNPACRIKCHYTTGLTTPPGHRQGPN